jgi:DNA-binding IclR family transcriptional regulator
LLEKNMSDPSVLGRLGALLEAYAMDRPRLTVADAGDLLKVSEATAYRYLGDLCQIGLLARHAQGYALGPKIIELEYILRQFDPVLGKEEETFRTLARSTNCHVLFCNFYGDTIINVHHEKADEPISLTFIKGRPMPLFRGSQAHILLAYMDRRRLKRLFEKHFEDEDLQRIGADWDSFNTAMRRIRKDGYYISRGELDPTTTGIAVPVLEDARIIGSLVLAFPSDKPAMLPESVLIAMVRATAEAMTERINRQFRPHTGS